MYLDYSLPHSSRYVLFLDAPFRYSWRHLIQYFHNKIIYNKAGIKLLTEKERMLHFCFAFLEVLPVLGIGVAIIDRLLFNKKITPKASIDFLVEKIVPLYCKVFGQDAKKEASLQEAYIPRRYQEEMKELAKTYNIPYGSILLANTILDRLHLFGGTFTKENRQSTIAICHFNGKKKRLEYAFGADYAANRSCSRLPLEWMHDADVFQTIDFPMGLISRCTKMSIHTDGPVFVGWCGIIGTYCGINKHGLIVRASLVAKSSQAGLPSHMLVRQILEEAKTIEEAKQLITSSDVASSMDVILTKGDEILRLHVE